MTNSNIHIKGYKKDFKDRKVRDNREGNWIPQHVFPFRIPSAEIVSLRTKWDLKGINEVKEMLRNLLTEQLLDKHGEVMWLAFWASKSMWVLGGQTVKGSLIEGVWFKGHSKGSTDIRNDGTGTLRDCTGAKSRDSLTQNEERAHKWGNHKAKAFETLSFTFFSQDTHTETQGSEGTWQRSVLLGSRHRGLKRDKF